MYFRLKVTNHDQAWPEFVCDELHDMDAVRAVALSNPLADNPHDPRQASMHAVRSPARARLPGNRRTPSDTHDPDGSNS